MKKKYDWSRAKRETLEALAERIHERRGVFDELTQLQEQCEVRLRTRAEVDAEIVRHCRNTYPNWVRDVLTLAKEETCDG